MGKKSKKNKKAGDKKKKKGGSTNKGGQGRKGNANSSPPSKRTSLAEVKHIIHEALQDLSRDELTPSEVLRWNPHDAKLLTTEVGEFGEQPRDLHKISNMYETDEDKWEPAEADGPKGSIEALRHALEISYRRWYVSGAPEGKQPGLIEHVAPLATYLRWATELATKYPLERINAIATEYIRDTQVHSNLLKDLQEKSIFDHIRARNCIFHDTFARCSLPSPPGVDFKEALVSNFLEHEDADMPGPDFALFYDMPCHQYFIQTWNYYQALAFALVNIVKAHPLEDTSACRPSVDLPAIVAAADRGPITPFVRPEGLEYLYDEIIQYGYNEEDDMDDCYGDDDLLLEQGVKPWDDDAGAVLAALHGAYD